MRLMCRLIGHRWRRYGVMPAPGYKCERCGIVCWGALGYDDQSEWSRPPNKRAK